MRRERKQIIILLIGRLASGAPCFLICFYFKPPGFGLILGGLDDVELEISNKR
jgi:hypothetical protein